MPGNGAYAPRWTPRGRTPGGYKVKDIQVDTLQVIASTPLTRHELKEHRALGREMEDMARNHRREMKSRVHGRTHCRHVWDIAGHVMDHCRAEWRTHCRACCQESGDLLAKEDDHRQNALDFVRSW